MSPSPSFQENQRLQTLYRYNVLDTASEAAFDRITLLASRLLGVPISLVSLVDQDRIWFKSRQGLDCPTVDREGSFCGFAMYNQGVYCINDTLIDPQWCDHPLVKGEFGLRFYAAAPLCTSDGQRLGTLCVMDHHPHELSELEVQTLQSLGELVIEQLDLRLASQRLQETEIALMQSESRFRALVEQAADGFLLHDFNGQILDVNEFACQSLGYTRKELLRLSIQQIETEPIPMILFQSLVPGQPIAIQRIYRRQDQTTFPVEVRLGLIQVGGQQLIHTLARDISERLEIEQQLKQQAERERLNTRLTQRIHESLELSQILNTTVTEVRQALKNERVIIFRFESDQEGEVLTESHAQECFSLLGNRYKDGCIQETLSLEKTDKVKSVADIYTGDISRCHQELLIKLQIRAYLVTPIWHGQKMWGLLVAHQCSNPRKWQVWEQELLVSLAAQLAIAIQQSELYHQLKIVNHELRDLATSDSLTGIANRRYFDEYLKNQWEQLSQEQAPLSVILCDLDFFKLYNDTYGHLAGDQALREIAQAISQAMKHPTDLLARYGGEEFAIILPKTSVADAILIAQSIQNQIEKLKIIHSGSSVSHYMTCSLGIGTVMPSEKMNAKHLIEIADQGLYQAKAQGRNQYVVSALSHSIGQFV
ncbi:diguanylate cyclase domain-containing protein [Planktothrix paucivesiculata]|uniref:Diguanylate cyclase n=1 Tax=Planktothrix paucivesiculata PCC 9631 TaxID=671071 RepID=A0A7Z9BXZ6_9CYAN|nr:diguanylate cyclase [Planktothrix paucivesiculata]VXD23241.1 putative Diguanylate cyclase [Planktothrix paucivesiculata PCC 9631]